MNALKKNHNMFHSLDAPTANELWIKAAEWFRAGGIATVQSSRAGNTQEVLNVAFTLNDPRQRWISARIPPMNPAFAIAEVVWILCGRNDSAMLNYFNPKLPKYAGEGVTYHGAYGYRLRQFFGIDQIDRAFKALSANDETRQVVLQIWDSRSDLPDEAGKPVSKDIPCNITSMLKIRDGRLEWTQIMRSNDLFRGFPHNVIQFSSLQEIIAGWLNLKLGAYHHYSDSLHLYATDGDVPSHMEKIAPPDNCDSLSIAKTESDLAFQNLSRLCDLFIQPDTKVEEILGSVQNSRLPEAHGNFAAILAADSLRRRNAENEMIIAVNKCTNPCLKFMFERWMQNRKNR